MFTGLIQHVGVIRAIDPSPAGKRLRIDLGDWNHRPSNGASISVNGCCLTVADIDATAVSFDVVPETLLRTALGLLEPGHPVNLEHAVTPQTLLGGHIVQGHVDAVGRVISIDSDDGQQRVRIDVPDSLQDCIVLKGSITLQGVSLTIAARGDDWFEVALIPETLQRTTLGSLSVGQPVNLEGDYVARIVVSWLERRTAGGS